MAEGGGQLEMKLFEFVEKDSDCPKCSTHSLSLITSRHCTFLLIKYQLIKQDI